MLNRRDFSVAELTRRLAGKDLAPDQVKAVIDRCLELGYLDDARYAVQRARSLMRQGRAVGVRILIDLRRSGIDESTAQQALEQARTEQSDADVLGELIERRFPLFDFGASTDKERRRIVQFLLRRGFPLDSILKKLTEKG
jgi:regulatory protein